MYELTTAVFEVKNGKLYSDTPKDLAVLRYVRLNAGMSRGLAISILKKQLEDEFKSSDVRFAFWCDTMSQSSGSPQDLHPHMYSPLLKHLAKKR